MFTSFASYTASHSWKRRKVESGLELDSAFQERTEWKRSERKNGKNSRTMYEDGKTKVAKKMPDIGRGRDPHVDVRPKEAGT